MVHSFSTIYVQPMEKPCYRCFPWIFLNCYNYLVRVINVFPYIVIRYFKGSAVHFFITTMNISLISSIVNSLGLLWLKILNSFVPHSPCLAIPFHIVLHCEPYSILRRNQNSHHRPIHFNTLVYLLLIYIVISLSLRRKWKCWAQLRNTSKNIFTYVLHIETFSSQYFC